MTRTSRRRVLIVHAHHEPTSFNGAMTREAVAALTEAGHEVVVSDLHAMGFDPVSDRRNFTTVRNADRLDQQSEESLAATEAGFVPELQAEIDKLLWCTDLIFQFPIWWLGLPAILKGWVDRVFALGVAYGGGRWFETGRLAGKRAMCALTVGGSAEVYGEAGVYAPVSKLLFPIHRGIFEFSGFTVIEPFVVYGPGRIGEPERLDYLARYRERVLSLETAPRIANLDRAGFDGLVRGRGSAPAG